MRILYISNSTSGGGAPTSLFNLLSVLNTKHEIAVVMPSDKGMLYDMTEKLGIKSYTAKPYCLDVWPKVFNPIKLIKRLYSLYLNQTEVRAYIGAVIDEFKPDIVHTNVGPLAIAVHECAKRGIPHVWHMREYQDKDFGMRFFPSKSIFRKMILQEGNYNLSITQDIFRHWNLRKGVDEVIYNGIRRSDTEVVPYVSQQPYFLYVARIEASKGLMTLLRAFRLYNKNGGTRRLLIVGKPCGLYSFWCKAYVRLTGLRKSVSFAGYRTDIYSLMTGAEAFVMTSLSEGFGLTTAEAMLNRCLVIARNTAGSKEQLDRGFALTGSEIGLRFDTYTQLASHLHSIESEKNASIFESMKVHAFNTVDELYTVGSYASKVEEFYNKVLRSSDL